MNGKPSGFKDADYFLGRVILPPQIYAKRMYPYIYAGSIDVAAGTTKILSLLMEPDAHFLVEGIEIVPGNNTAYENAFVTITDTSRNEAWSNLPVNLRDISGMGFTPKYLSDPMLVFPNSTIQVSINSNITGTKTFYVVLHGRKIYDLTQSEATYLMRRMWFQYVMVLPTLAAGTANLTSTMQVFNQSDFLVKKLYSTDIMQFVLATATTGTESAEIMMQLKDGATDQNFFSQKLAARLVVGSQWGPWATNSGGASIDSAGDGFMLRKPIFIPRTGSILGTFDNKSITTATGLKLVFEGTRIFS